MAILNMKQAIPKYPANYQQWLWWSGGGGAGGVGVGSGVGVSDGDIADCFSFCAQYAECISDDLTNLLSATSRRNLGRMDLRNVGNTNPSLLCHYPK